MRKGKGALPSKNLCTKFCGLTDRREPTNMGNYRILGEKKSQG